MYFDFSESSKPTVGAGKKLIGIGFTALISIFSAIGNHLENNNDKKSSRKLQERVDFQNDKIFSQKNLFLNFAICEELRRSTILPKSRFENLMPCENFKPG